VCSSDLEAFGLKGYDSKTRKKLTADQVLKLVWLKTKTDYSTISLEPADLKEFGLDIKKIKTTSAAEAKAAWQQEIIKRAEAAAKTKKGKKPARDEQEEETGEEGDDE
jgi:ribosomal protein L12E/L44/L45/RPP1/RPP2